MFALYIWHFHLRGHLHLYRVEALRAVASVWERLREKSNNGNSTLLGLFQLRSLGLRG